MSLQTFEKSSPPPSPRTEKMSQTLGATTGYRPASECRAPARVPVDHPTVLPPYAARRNLQPAFDAVESQTESNLNQNK